MKQVKLSQEQLDGFREMLKPGMDIYTVLHHVSQSGMCRHIGLLVVDNGKIINVTYIACRVLGLKRASDGGAVISGCGMDMGFEIVYELGRVLYAAVSPSLSFNHKWL
jgi:hypothetical protein